jgi:hypothetical protein
MTRQRLWIPVIAPLTWSCHFTVVTIVAALSCGRFSVSGYRLTMVLTTVLALVVIGSCLGYGIKLLRFSWPDDSHDADTAEDRRKFLGYTTVILAGLSAIATVYSTIALFVVGGCA